MRCIRPLKASFDRNGDLTHSSRNRDPSLVSFEFECRKCLPCRLNTAREKAIRCWHESQNYEDNIFLTLTYNEESLESPRLIYPHFQKFMKDLRYREGKKIPMMVTGEYGDENKRPHWHALLFNYRPIDAIEDRETDRGDRVYTSRILNDLWSRGNTEFGSLTIDSANYVARYAAKKLTHGRDQDHDFHPIHKTSSKYGLGRSWIEKHWERTFEQGFVNLPNGQISKIPRYYVDWAKRHHPSVWEYYVTQIRPNIMILAEESERKELELYIKNREDTQWAQTRSKIKLTILESKFKQLQERLKL